MRAEHPGAVHTECFEIDEDALLLGVRAIATRWSTPCRGPDRAGGGAVHAAPGSVAGGDGYVQGPVAMP
jgi:hypothetical protein